MINNNITPEQILISSKITTLPVDIFKISQCYNIKIIPFSLIRKFEYDYSQLKTQDLLSLCKKHPFGFTLIMNAENIIFYDEFQPANQIRWTVAHELAHIFLGHTTKQTLINKEINGKRSIYDVMADNFASNLLCPPLVAHFCAVSSALEIKTMSEISISASQIVFEQINNIRKKGVFLRNKEDYLIYNLFSNFIESYLSKKLA